MDRRRGSFAAVWRLSRGNFLEHRSNPCEYRQQIPLPFYHSLEIDRVKAALPGVVRKSGSEVLMDRRFRL